MPLVELLLCAGLVATKKCAGRVSSISTSHVGPDQPDPRSDLNPKSNPLGGSGSVEAIPRLRRVFWWRFSKKDPDGRKASLDHYDPHPVQKIVVFPQSFHGLFSKRVLVKLICSIICCSGLLPMYMHFFLL